MRRFDTPSLLVLLFGFSCMAWMLATLLTPDRLEVVVLATTEIPTARVEPVATHTPSAVPPTPDYPDEVTFDCPLRRYTVSFTVRASGIMSHGCYAGIVQFGEPEYAFADLAGGERILYGFWLRADGSLAHTTAHSTRDRLFTTSFTCTYDQPEPWQGTMACGNGTATVLGSITKNPE